MNYVEITLAKQKFPMSFGLWAMKNLCDDLGIAQSEFIEALNKNPLSFSIDLAYHTMKDGFRKANKEFTLTKPQIADLLDQDESSITKLFNAFIEAQGIDVQKDIAEEQDEEGKDQPQIAAP